MNDSQLLNLLRCPVDGQSLTQATDTLVAELNKIIASGELRDASDGIVQESLDGALITTDGCRAHAIRGGIPTLIPGESIVVPESLRQMDSPSTASH